MEHIYKVVKPIYGMARAGRRWQRTLYPWLLEQGLTKLHADPNVFTLTRTMDTPSGPREETITIGVYVDDICILYKYNDLHFLCQFYLEAL